MDSAAVLTDKSIAVSTHSQNYQFLSPGSYFPNIFPDINANNIQDICALKQVIPGQGMNRNRWQEKGD